MIKLPQGQGTRGSADGDPTARIAVPLLLSPPAPRSRLTRQKAEISPLHPASSSLLLHTRPGRARAKSLCLHVHGRRLLVCSSKLQSRSLARSRSRPGLSRPRPGVRRETLRVHSLQQDRRAERIGEGEMMVGKRERDCKNPMRRTTSMTEFAPPDVLTAVAEDEEAQLPDNSGGGQQDWLSAFGAGAAAQEDWRAAYRARAAPARAGLRRNSADYSVVETAAFLRACGLCCRRLGPGRDTFMYKGEEAFCSLECRERHITQEEWKDKCAVKSANSKDAAAGAATPVTGRRAGSGKPGAGGGTVAAA
ncbi:FCS-Like Zinc finger 6-like [Panicum virgatum]|uniref:FLZ-type domain-containing protein n=1 Tax=Panicum virgatum TaxID=38727 RepID=A0A8T0WB43_PANVG|nr:FCS-Like Zinc finger 6-like [Panicum virgatum]KAG2643066.1 hypothetical protein PVAP13_2KG328500 [Panicum virgatum]